MQNLMKVLLAVVLCFQPVLPRLSFGEDETYRSQVLDDTPHRTKYSMPYESKAEEPELESLQCPIPMENRVRNHTGIQCVFSSIEMLGRWAEEPKLTNPPITSRDDCKSYSGPQDAGQKLTRLGVKFEQTYGNRSAGIAMIKKAMAEGRGCLFDISGHAMVLVHYDEKADRVCWVDNSDRSLRVQTTTVKGFDGMWRGWILVIYADEDIIPYKLSPLDAIPIISHKSQQRTFPKGYIPKP